MNNINTALGEGKGDGKCVILTSYCISVPRVLTRVVVQLFYYHNDLKESISQVILIEDFV